MTPFLPYFTSAQATYKSHLKTHQSFPSIHNTYRPVVNAACITKQYLTPPGFSVCDEALPKQKRPALADLAYVIQGCKSKPTLTLTA